MTFKRFAILVMPICGLGVARASSQGAPIDTPWKEFNPKGDELVALCRKLDIPCGFERTEINAFASESKLKTRRRTNTTARDVLNAFTGRHKTYKWTMRGPVLNLEPKRAVGEDILSRTLKEVNLKGLSSFRSSLDVLAQAGIRFSYQLSGPKRPFGLIDLALKDVTVREALNAIAEADGQVAWIISHDQNPKRKGTVMFQMVSWRKTGVPFSAEERTGVRFIEKK